MQTLTLRRPLERALREGHPWVYRDAITGSAPPGAIVRLLDARGDFVATGIADEGPIAMRVFSVRDEAVGPALFASRIQRAASLRDRVLPLQTDAYRLLNGEGDRLPGFVCDLYGPFAVLKTDGAGALAHRDAMAEALRPVLEARGVHTLLLRTSGRSGRGEGQQDAPKATVAWGETPPDELIVNEHGMRLSVDLLHGQKTGLFLDQRESRARVRTFADGLRVLNLYAYTGGFSVAAGLGGARSVETVDVAPGAIALSERTWLANGLDPSKHRAIAADVPAHMAALTKQRARFDLVIADPPSFAPSATALDAALKSYRALHASCLSLLAPGGLYVAGSCSSHVTRELFNESVLEGARRAKRLLQWIDGWGPPADHPRPAAFPEGDYLKVNVYRAD